MISLRTISVQRQATTIQLPLCCHLIISVVHSWRIHRGQNRDRERDKEQMSCIRLCGSFQITPELGQGVRPIVSHCSGPGPCSCLGPYSAQYEYAIKRRFQISPGNQVGSDSKSIRQRLLKSNTGLFLFVTPQMDQQSTKSLDAALTFDTCAKAGGCPTKS